MQIHLRGRYAGVSEQLSHHVDPTPGISGVTAKSVTELVRTHRLVQPGTPGRGCEQLADRARAHRGADRLTEQLHRPDVTRPSPRPARPLQHVRVGAGERAAGWGG